MDHEEALKIQAPEKYLLGEFSELERDQFEDHFFDCQACAAEVRAGAVFEANARAVFADQARDRATPALAPPARQQSELARLAGTSAGPGRCLGALVAVAGRGELPDTGLPQPGWRRSMRRRRLSPLSCAPTRGATSQAVKPAANARFLSLALQLPPDLNSPSYDCRVFNEAGPWFSPSPPRLQRRVCPCTCLFLLHNFIPVDIS